jgi:ASC-1-like (ASCH) protein
MELRAYDGKNVHITTVWGEVFEGEAVYDSEDYCESEYGWAEESLNLEHWVFRRSDIASAEVMEGEPRIWLSRRMHTMHLVPSAFDRMEDGKKTIELRLNDPKRREIRVGDMIRFEGVEEDWDVLHMEVKELLPFPSFKELYAALPLSEMGYSPEEEKTASPADMDRYYTPEDQARWGVLAIRVAEPDSD